MVCTQNCHLNFNSTHYFHVPRKYKYRPSANSFRPWIVSAVFRRLMKGKLMLMYCDLWTKNFKKRIVSAETIRGNTVDKKCSFFPNEWKEIVFSLFFKHFWKPWWNIFFASLWLCTQRFYLLIAISHPQSRKELNFSFYSVWSP